MSSCILNLGNMNGQMFYWTWFWLSVSAINLVFSHFQGLGDCSSRKNGPELSKKSFKIINKNSWGAWWNNL